MKRVLVISPYFPPFNTPDLHRIRMSLPYFENFGWDATVVTVQNKYLEAKQDPLLLLSIPDSIKVISVKAFPFKWTSKIGLGSIALRSLLFYLFEVNNILKKDKFDLIYFSTTQFPLCVLGAYWKKRFKMPFVIDMQDPWHTDYYKDKPKAERPSKYWFSYRLNKLLEPIAMRNVDGLLSVSGNYLLELNKRYRELRERPQSVITFGYSEKDLEISKTLPFEIDKKDEVQFYYVGVVGVVMQRSLRILLEALKEIKNENLNKKRIKFYFKGTSYDTSKKTYSVMPLAKEYTVDDYVDEQPERLSFYQTLNLIRKADNAFILGTDDPGYTASKIYPYILSRTPFFAILHRESSAVEIINNSKAGRVFCFNSCVQEDLVLVREVKQHILNITSGLVQTSQTQWEYFKQFSAHEMTRKQVKLFNTVIEA